MQEPTPRPSRKRRPYTSGDAAIDDRIRELVEELDTDDPELAFEMLATAARLSKEGVSRLDRKMANSALKEMRYAFSVFARYRGIRKVSVFGSARVCEGDPEYDTAVDFGRLIAEKGWMVTTGAGPGIMQAAHEGAGGDASFGVNILLPFEAEPNPVIAGDPKLINFKYFFTRKVMFVKEADAFVLLPGGFGTMDESYELLTLIQTGKSDLHPIVLLERPGGKYWHRFDAHLRENLIERGYVDEADLSFYKCMDDPAAAVEEILRFYRVYHSQRYVGGRLVFRLNHAPDDATLARLSEDFSDILTGPVVQVAASQSEIRDDDVPDLPRIALPFDRTHAGRLRQLIDRLNEMPVPEGSS